MRRTTRTSTLLALALALAASAAASSLFLGLEDELVAPGAAAWDQAGRAVALSGDTLIVGASSDDGGGLDAGAAYVFRRGGGGWSFEAELAALDAAPGDLFGAAVAIDGDTAVVGAPADDDAGATSGAAYVFARSGAVWTQQAKLAAGDAGAGDGFGGAVAVDGGTVVVGARGQASHTGATYVFVGGGASWVEQQKLLASDAGSGRAFGAAIALDGDRCLIGADGAARGAYVFERAAGLWSQQQKLLDPGGHPSDLFGTAVALQGGRAVVGAPRDDANGPDSGTVFVYELVGASWVEQARLRPGEGLGEVGTSVALDGDVIAAGAPFDHALGDQPVGAAYVFAHEAGVWSVQTRVDRPGAALLDETGAAVALAGGILAVGAPGVDVAAVNAGAVLVHAVVPGVALYCFGDGMGTACPCGNASTQGGCANGSGLGATLTPSGVPSLSGASFQLTAENLVPNQPALLFGASNRINGGAGVGFGDGLRCAGGGIARLGVKQPDGLGVATWGPSPFAPAWSAGEVKRFQVWYRDPQGTPCGTGFNLTNGAETGLLP